MYKYAIGNLHNVPLERPEIFARGRLHASVPRPRPGALYHITNERTAQAMRKTNLYGLNLWDLEDRIRMEDFNSDNETLEAALSALAGRQGVVSYPLYHSDTPVNFCGPRLFLTDTGRLSDYTVFLIAGSVTSAGNGGTPRARLVKMQGNTFPVIPGTQFEFAPGAFCYILLPMRSAGRTLQGFFLSQDKFQAIHQSSPMDEVMYLYLGSGAGGASDPNMWIQDCQVLALR